MSKQRANCLQDFKSTFNSIGCRCPVNADSGLSPSRPFRFETTPCFNMKRREGYMKQDVGRILIVDDDAEVLLAAELVLKRQFAEVVTAGTPQTIESLLRKHNF